MEVQIISKETIKPSSPTPDQSIDTEIMEVQIISKETIKPSSPTPDHLRTHNLCLFDQLASRYYTQTILFYSGRHENPRIHVSDHLKNSLSKVLVHFYPFAGRIKDDVIIDCNDDGVTFVEAQVSCDLASVLEDRENVELLQKLLPCQQSFQSAQPGVDQVLLLVQVNYFACGGIAISVCISHIIADASGVTNFIKSWADVARGADKVENVIMDFSSLFPVRDLSTFFRTMSALNSKSDVESLDEVVQKMFVFEGSKIDALRKEMGSDDVNDSFRPTRVLAVMGLIWEALIDVTARGVSPILAVTNTVNLRNRMNPPLPQKSLSNINTFAMARAGSRRGEDIINRVSLSRKIQESIKEIDDEFIRKMFTGTTDECFTQHLLKTREELGVNSNVGMFFFSCCCRLPFYEADFGWGKPVWFGNGWSVNRNGVLVDTSDGEGIEARISLTKQEMAKFQQYPAIRAYATFKPLSI